MEQLGVLEGVQEKDCMEINSVVDKVKKGLTKVEAGELHQVGKLAFLHVKQLWFSYNGKEGPYFNLIQLPIEIEIDLGTRLPHDYQVDVFLKDPPQTLHMEKYSLE